jgi:hypothetical protein
MFQRYNYSNYETLSETFPVGDTAENRDESQRHGRLKNKDLMTKNILQLDLLVTKGIRTKDIRPWLSINKKQIIAEVQLDHSLS